MFNPRALLLCIMKTVAASTMASATISSLSLTNMASPTVDTALSPERRLERMFQRIVSSGAITFSASHVAGVSSALESQITQSHRRQESGLRDLVRQLVLPEGYDADRFVEESSKSLAKQAVTNTETLMSAAVIILAHSTADDIFNEACGLSIELDPDSWRKELNLKRKVLLEDLMDLGEQKILARELTAYQKNMKQKSLPERADVLFRHVPIRHHGDIPKTAAGYFTLDKLKHLDELRNLIVHGDGIPHIERQYSKDAAMFLNEAAWVAFRSVGVAYKIVFDMQRATNGIVKPPITHSWPQTPLRTNDR
jgi:hypothetical protein